MEVSRSRPRFHSVAISPFRIKPNKLKGVLQVGRNREAMFTNYGRFWDRCCYRLDGVTDRNQWRSYWGSFKIRPGSTSRVAGDNRFGWHRKSSTPWFRWVKVESLLLEPMGPVLSWQQGLLQEAILAASHIDANNLHRGGPWSQPDLKPPARGQIREVARIARSAGSAAQARRNVLSYALTLPEDDPLRCHVEDRLWGSRSKSGQPAAEAPKRRIAGCIFPRRPSGPP
jgi:hypothetical protein